MPSLLDLDLDPYWGEMSESNGRAADAGQSRLGCIRFSFAMFALLMQGKVML